MTEYFNAYIDIPHIDFWKNLCEEQGMEIHYDRGEEFVRAGDVCRYFGYIRSGTLKYAATSDDGNEHVIGLEFAGEFVADFPFSLYGEKSRVSIIAVSPCVIQCVPVKTIASLMKQDMKIREIVMHSTEAIFSTVYDRYMSLYCQSPQQRYDRLVTLHPDLFTLFPLKEIASFLNITPTHLSRLRKNH